MSIRPKKSLGQHFLTDENIIQKIADAIPADEGERVIEIGPGTGALTGALLDRFEDLVAVELDQRAIEVLEQKFDDLEIHHENVLDVNWEELSIGKEKTHVVGNLPYYITSQILFSLLENRHLLTDALLMMQKEVAERLVSDIRTKDYGILSVQTQLMCTPEILFPVSRHCFSPQPNVESAIVKLTFDKGALNCSDKNLKTVVRTAFNQRRKKLSNALKPVVSKDKQPSGFDFDKRAEAWEPSEYEKLTARLVDDGILT
ncbi:16S rRNA (adenine(1518)-N(6)/adenine(1519)-N(6))-dimethyltransferase RsmA [Fodinibius sp. Rm-B-1B1-1]|uniref:16S rRNA (adenine(1518)-N(6)/adenine(1519)-N(6))- dimethyltransferase RsmA n=1 Tax=Fodinibius alkaliphilus TaxID=3140241 RepID=UPI00315A9886